ncbi:hypothetical protein LWI28_028161 [Acer negundo]|uniref:Uncharacterized protein n=1 Tax=Acer negundo TaxID=4023 RepID=A0AAD5J731_ACENE|nr:hypothetical protein LWI28_028161 [Acer negundo]
MFGAWLRASNLGKSTQFRLRGEGSSDRGRNGGVNNSRNGLIGYRFAASPSRDGSGEIRKAVVYPLGGRSGDRKQALMQAAEVTPAETVLGGPKMLDVGANKIKIEGTGTEGDQSVVTVEPGKKVEEKQDVGST